MARHFIKAPAVGKGELSTEQSSTPSTAKTAGEGRPRGRARRSVELDCKHSKDSRGGTAHGAEQGGPWKENYPEEPGFQGQVCSGGDWGWGWGLGGCTGRCPQPGRLTGWLCPCSRLREAPAGVHGLHRAGRRARLWPGRPHLDGGLQVVSPHFSATSAPMGPAGDAASLFFWNQ